MGSCVSRSSTPVAPIVTAKAVFQDGSVAQFAVPATARDALAGGDGASSSFVCYSDELRFDTPPRAMGAHDALRPGELYFALPFSALHRPLSGEDMAALAVKASAALGASAVAGGSSSSVSLRGKSARAGGKQRPQTTARVAPLVAGADHMYGGYEAWKTVHGDPTVGKGRIARRRAGLQRLSAILEGSE